MKETLGLGTAWMRKVEIFVVLPSRIAPYVLQLYGETYHFMSREYVHELIQGELVNETEAGITHERSLAWC